MAPASVGLGIGRELRADMLKRDRDVKIHLFDLGVIVDLPFECRDDVPAIEHCLSHCSPVHQK